MRLNSWDDSTDRSTPLISSSFSRLVAEKLASFHSSDPNAVLPTNQQLPKIPKFKEGTLRSIKNLPDDVTTLQRGERLEIMFMGLIKNLHASHIRQNYLVIVVLMGEILNLIE